MKMMMTKNNKIIQKNHLIFFSNLNKIKKMKNKKLKIKNKIKINCKINF